MNRFKFLLPALLFAVVAAGCSSMEFSHDWDKDADFATYRTYAWVNVPTTAVGDAQAARRTNALLDKRIKSAVDAEMKTKGFSVDTASPDLLVVYHVGVQDKVNVTDWGYRYSYDYYGWGGRNIDVYQYTEGTLILDLIDAQTKELVWRGSAMATLEDNPSPEKAEARLQQAVQGIMANYPPRGR
ncbi:MAG: DUF4136 domain-containing protein [Candidatus Krumholzibacteria bacterium]|nr:DUF4136 domain-containing protein [Candidatus Krumholzibacteria bacterium]